MVVLTYSKACFIGAMVECVFYGLYFLLFLRCLEVLRKKTVRGSVSGYLWATTFILFILITLRLILDNKAVVAAFTDNPEIPNAADTAFMVFNDVWALLRTGIYIVLTIISDLFIIYRVFIVWGGSYPIAAVPILLFLADVVTGSLSLDALKDSAVGSDPNMDIITQRITIFYSITLALNLLCTLLIASKIWLIQQKSRGLFVAGLNSLDNTISIIVESAALYSATLVAVIICATRKSNVHFIFLSLLPGVIGIVFSLIIVRVGSGTSHSSNGAPPLSTLNFGGVRTMGRTETTDHTTSTSVPKESVQVYLHESESRDHGDTDVERNAGLEKGLETR